jgi:hypothetical protein
VLTDEDFLGAASSEREALKGFPFLFVYQETPNLLLLWEAVVPVLAKII